MNIIEVQPCYYEDVDLYSVSATGEIADLFDEMEFDDIDEAIDFAEEWKIVAEQEGFTAIIKKDSR